jgi:hypothetical protein
MRTEFWLGTLEGRNHSEDLDGGGRIILNGSWGKSGFRVWIGFIWLRIETCGWLL